MWLSRHLIDSQQKSPAVSLARVAEDNGAKEGRTDGQYRLCAPWGIAWRPPSLAEAVFVQSGNGSACVGTLADPDGLPEGELRLFSAGGASIWLKNSGEIVVNGQVFEPEQKKLSKGI